MSNFCFKQGQVLKASAVRLSPGFPRVPPFPTHSPAQSAYGLLKFSITAEPSAVRAWRKSFSELPDWGDCFVNIYKSSIR